MQKLTSSVAAIALFVVALVAVFIGAPNSAQPSSALGNASIFWIYNNGGAGNRVVQAAEAATLTPTAITPATASGYTYRTLASDGTYLYFVDNSNASIVRTDLSGGNRTVLTSTSGPQQVWVFGSTVYYTEWNNGLYSVPAAGGTPTQIFAPSTITSTCVGASGGWGGVSVTATNLFFSWYNGSPSNTACYGVYQSARSGSTFGTPVKLAAPTGGWTGPGQLQTSNNDLYVIQTGTGFDKTSDYATWTHFSVSAGSFSLQALSVYGSNIYMTSNLGSVFTMPATDTTGSSITRLFTNAAASSGYAIVAMSPPTYTVTYTNGGGTGVDLVQTIAQGSSLTLPAPTACPASATDPCFTAPTGQRVNNNWAVTAGSISSGSSFPQTGTSITPTSNVTLAARWTGGPLQYSTTSFSAGGTAMSTIDFPVTLAGGSSQLTVYVYNSGSASTMIANDSVNGTGVSHPSGTCNVNGGVIAAAGQCTIVLQWNPSSAGSLTGSYSMQVTGSYNDSVALTGTARTNTTVTFNNNSGSGSLSPQSNFVTTPLTSNCVSGTCSITRAGYDFNGWNTQALGSGTPYADGANYDFLNSATMYAQWTAQTFVVTFNTGGGSSVSTGSFTTGGSLTLPAAPTQSGYTFNGWFTAATGGTLAGQAGASYTPSNAATLTLYAQWTASSSGGSGSSGANGAMATTGIQASSAIAAGSALIVLGMLAAFAAWLRRRTQS